MKYITTFTIRPENIKAAIERFKETGGQPPAGVTMLGRWHEMGTNCGFTLMEFNDPVAVSKFGIEWGDILDQRVAPVVEDAEIAAAIQ